MEEKKIVLFDGVCNFCNYWVRFIIKRDRKKKFQFAALQSETARQMLHDLDFDASGNTSVILIDKGKMYTRSTASLRIAKSLSGGWKLLYALMIFPRFLRDGVYNLIARHRYKWFGKKETCMVPRENVKDRFLL